MLPNFFKIAFVVLVLSLFINSCSNSTEPEVLSPIDISKVKNIQWNLISAETSSQKFDLSDYEPFRIVLLNNNKIWGIDNCNSLRGNYSIVNDTLTIADVGVTERGCPLSNFFPFEHLFARPKMTMRGTRLLLLSTNDAIYVYGSNLAQDIYQQSFLNDTLSLKNSNDVNISVFDSLSLYPKLLLNSEREFDIRWYNKLPENTGFINMYSGVFGINENEEILFTKINSAYEGNGVSIRDWELVDRVVASTRFEYNGITLRVTNNTTRTYYEFGK
ncbi:MAG TPA: META domain-containing protein [bacterium]